MVCSSYNLCGKRGWAREGAGNSCKGGVAPLIGCKAVQGRRGWLHGRRSCPKNMYFAAHHQPAHLLSAACRPSIVSSSSSPPSAAAPLAAAPPPPLPPSAAAATRGPPLAPACASPAVPLLPSCPPASTVWMCAIVAADRRPDTGSRSIVARVANRAGLAAASCSSIGPMPAPLPASAAPPLPAPTPELLLAGACLRPGSGGGAWAVAVAP